MKKYQLIYIVICLLGIGCNKKADDVTGPVTLVPSSPSGFKVKRIEDVAYLSWKKASNSENSGTIKYVIYRGNTSSTKSKIAETVDTNYTNQSLNTENTYYYSVTAKNNSGESSYSDEVTSIPFINGTNGEIRAMYTYKNYLYIGGDFTRIGSLIVKNVAMYDGTTWTAMGEGLSGKVNCLTADDNGLVYAGGEFNGKISRFANGYWSSVGNITESSDINALAFINSDLYVGGDFSRLGGKNLRNIGKYSGFSWDTLRGGLFVSGTSGGDGAVNSLFVKDGYLYAGGSFARTNNLGNDSLKNIAKWDGFSWKPLSSGLGGVYVAHVVRCIGYYGGRIYAGGRFTYSGSYTLANIANYDDFGNRWYDINTGTNSLVAALAVNGFGLAIGGYFSQVGGSSHPNFKSLALYAGVWTNMGYGFENDDASVQAIASYNNTFFIGGNFTCSNSNKLRNLGQWNGNSINSLVLAE